jgi:Zn finger protein HypA/HybF involved in hydrogenase expression
MKIKLPILECKRCGKKWIPKKEDVRQCPKCKSAYWDIEDDRLMETKVLNNIRKQK